MEKAHKVLHTKKMNRRDFFIKSICYSAGFSLLISPGMSSEAMAVKRDETKEEMFRELDGLVDEYIPRFQTCSQTTFYVLNKVFKLNAEEFVKSLASMPGIALRGETCGAVTGSLLAIAMVYEEDIFDNEKKRLSREPSYKFCTKFEERYGTTRCRDVIETITGKRYDVTKPEDYDLLAKENVFNHCMAVIKDAAHAAAALILEKYIPVRL